VIAVGDYNMRQGSEMYSRISDVLVNSWSSIYPDFVGPQHPTIGVRNGAVPEPIDMTRRIDHIFYSPNFSTTETYYLPSPQSETDHPAHWSILTWQ
jgi:endonuclease/exonuclease/phosphatase family metal-dependent hydrolase